MPTAYPIIDAIKSEDYSLYLHSVSLALNDYVSARHCFNENSRKGIFSFLVSPFTSSLSFAASYLNKSDDVYLPKILREAMEGNGTF